MQRVCRVWAVPRATHYDRRSAGQEAEKRSEHRSDHWLSDAQLVEKIREQIHSTEEAYGFYGEGYRKVWARLRGKGVRTSRRRVLRLMREHELLAPHRKGNEAGPRVHDGTIKTETPDEMWGTDATAIWTRMEGLVTVFFVVDHCTVELLGVHAAKKATRFEALEPIRQAIKYTHGAFGRDVASGVKLRHDHGSQFTSNHYQDEIKFLGIESSPSYVRCPEGNGLAERMVRTLKEQLLWQRDFEDAEDVRAALQEFRNRYNESWILQRHGYLSPAAVRRQYAAPLREAA